MYGLGAYTGGAYAAGPLLFLVSAASYNQDHYQWRLNDGSESAATDAAAEDTSISVAKLTPRRIRTQVDESGDPPNQALILQARKVGTTDWKNVRKL